MGVNVTPVQTDSAPKAVGPYSQAIASSELIFCSGQVGIDPSTGKMVEGGVQEQAKQVLKNLRAVVEAAGSDMRHVVKTTVFFTNIKEDFAPVNAIYKDAFEGHAPARSGIEVAGLPLGALVEIEAIAVKK